LKKKTNNIYIVALAYTSTILWTWRCKSTAPQIHHLIRHYLPPLVQHRPTNPRNYQQSTLRWLICNSKSFGLTGQWTNRLLVSHCYKFLHSYTTLVMIPHSID